MENPTASQKARVIAAARANFAGPDIYIDRTPTIEDAPTANGSWVAAWVFVADFDAGVNDETGEDYV